jgi:hypothetical protein
MQLSDVFEPTDPVEEAAAEMRFQQRLKKLSRIPEWKKAERLQELSGEEFGFQDLIRIFGE